MIINLDNLDQYDTDVLGSALSAIQGAYDRRDVHEASLIAHLDGYLAVEHADNDGPDPATVVAVVFGVAEYDNGYWYDQVGATATLTDGSTVELVDFDSADEELIELSHKHGPLGANACLTVNMRDRTVQG